MIERPTPETDAFSVKFKSVCGSKAWVPTDICRRFERERTEAREQAEHWRGEYEIVVDRLRGRKHPRDNGIIAPDEIIPKLERERDEVREERDIARLERDEAIADYQRVYKERDEAVAECKSLWSLVNANKLRAYKAERERDEAREALSAAKHCLTKERDDALSQIVQAECRAERFCQERDEARETLREIQAANWRTAGELRGMARRALEDAK